MFLFLSLTLSLKPNNENIFKGMSWSEKFEQWLDLMILSFNDNDAMVVFLSKFFCIYALNCLPSLRSDEISKKKESINTYRIIYK